MHPMVQAMVFCEGVRFRPVSPQWCRRVYSEKLVPLLRRCNAAPASCQSLFYTLSSSLVIYTPHKGGSTTLLIVDPESLATQICVLNTCPIELFLLFRSNKFPYSHTQDGTGCSAVWAMNSVLATDACTVLAVCRRGVAPCSSSSSS